MNKEKLQTMVDVWNDCTSYNDIASKVDLSVLTIKAWGKKVNAKFNDKCQPKVRRRKKMEDLIDEVFAV
jgi:uncharacterized protein YjcR